MANKFQLNNNSFGLLKNLVNSAETYPPQNVGTVPNPEMLVIPYRDKQNVYSCWWLNCGIGRILQKISCCQENIKKNFKATYNTFS